MRTFKLDRSWLAALALLAIYCACSGCQVLQFRGMPGGNATSSGMHPLKSGASSDGRKLRERSSIQQVSNTEVAEGEDDATSLPPLPASDSNRELAISLTDAMSQALSNNMHLRVIVNLSDEVSKRTDIEKAQFDATVNANAQYMQGTQQVSSALQAVRGGQPSYGMTSVGALPGSPNLLSAEQRFSTGTVARIGLGSNYNMNSPIGQYLIYNPAYQTAGSLILEQPLFRGRSREANMAGIRIAQIGERESSAEFQAEVNQVLADVQRAYWLAWLAESQLTTAKGFVERAESIHTLEQKRFELGEGGIVQTAAAAENLYTRKAELAQAQQKSRSARNRLFTLLGLPPDDRRELKMMDAPIRERSILDLEHGLLVAKQQRPELEVRALQVNQAQLELDRRKNHTQPDVRAYAGYSLTGLNDSMMGSFNQFGTADFGSMSMGLRYGYVFGQRAEKAAVNQAQLALMRQIRARQETEFLVQQQVRDASDAVNSAWEVLKCQEERVAAARTQAETFRQLHAAGQIDLDRQLRADQQLSNALQLSHNALIDYNIALTDWRYATGAMSSKLPAESSVRETPSHEESPADVVPQRIPQYDSQPLHEVPAPDEIPPAPRYSDQMRSASEEGAKTTRRKDFPALAPTDRQIE